MAARDLLPVSLLQHFKEWCEDNQIEYRPGRDPQRRQVLQIKLGTAWQCIYRNAEDPEYHSVPDPLVPVVNRFLKDIEA